MYKEGKVDPETIDRIANHFGCVAGPIYVVLFAKLYTGIRMVKLRFKKGAFMTYYVTSWTFYGSLITQTSIIVLVQWDILKAWVCALAVICLMFFVPAWVIMNIHRKLIEEQAFEKIN